MDKLVPNQTQRDDILMCFEKKYQDKSIRILDSGLVLQTCNVPGSKIVGQVILFKGVLMGFSIKLTAHELIYQADLKPSQSELELLKDRVRKLEETMNQDHQ